MSSRLADSVDAVLTGTPYAADSLLPGPAALLDRLAGHLADPAAPPATLAVIGLRRTEDGWSTAPAVLATVTALLAGGLRAEDWLAREGTAEFAVVLGGGPDAAEIAVRRMVDVVSGVIAGVVACAGVAALEPGLHAPEARRRALRCLAVARSRGNGEIVRYAGGR